MKISYFFLTIVLHFLLAGCHKEGESEGENNRDSPRIKNFSTLVSPKNRSRFALGDEITFGFKAEKTIDSIQLEYRDLLISSADSILTWDSGQARTGNQRVKLTVYMGEEVETHYQRITFLSDIAPANYTYRVVNTYPHQKDAYTQGLFFKNDTLFESTGTRGESKLMKVNYLDASVYKAINLEGKYFGEGSTFWKDRIYQLTWTSQTGFIYDNEFNLKSTFRYSHEGWGITTMGDTLVVSDGTKTLHFLNPQDLSEIDKLEVYDNRQKIEALNELEFIEGLIYANIYQKELIVGIDPNTGKVVKEIDMAGLLNPGETKGADVLNGIAYNPTNQGIYVTGKYWPKLFQVEFIKK